MKKIWNAEEKLQYERALQKKGYRYIAGVDEVGRGPLAGPVVCAAVIMPLDDESIIVGVDDSKKLSVDVPLDESMAYQEVILMATDKAGNVSMPFGCDLTNSVLGETDVQAVILYGGREVKQLVVGSEPKELEFAYKSGDRYVTINEGTTADGKILWSSSIIEKSAGVSLDGVLTGDIGARGIVTASLEGQVAYVELIAVDLATLDMMVKLPEEGLIYDGTAFEPEVVLDLDETIAEGVDYTISYLNNVNAGTANAVITAMDSGKCTGVRILNFPILPRSFEDLTISIADDQSATPAVTVKFGERELVKDTDYTVTYNLHPAGHGCWPRVVQPGERSQGHGR